MQTSSPTTSRAAYLEQGETVVWNGAPVPGGPLPLSAMLVSILGVLLLLWGAAWAWMVFQTMGFAPGMLPMASPFLALGALLAIHGPRSVWKRRRIARYVLTDRKLVLLPDGPDGKWIVILPEHVSPSELRIEPNRGGTGTIHLAAIPFAWASGGFALWTLEHVANPESIRARIANAFRTVRATAPELPQPIALDTPLQHALAPVLQPEEPILWHSRGKKGSHVITDRRVLRLVPGPVPLIYAYPPEHWGSFQANPNRDGTWNLTYSWSSMETSRRIHPPSREGMRFQQDTRSAESMDGIRDPARALRVLQTVLARHRIGNGI